MKFTPDDWKNFSDLKDACDEFLREQLALMAGALGAAAVGTPVRPSRPLSGLVVADFNGDAKSDSLSLSGSRYYLQLQVADGNLAPRTRNEWPQGIYAWAVAADLNKDGKTDLVMCCGTANPSDGASRLATALGKGDGTFQAPVDSIPATGAFAYVDWNGDGTRDVLSLTPSGTLTVALGQINGTLQVARTSGAVSGHSVVAADATGDGRADAIVLDYTAVTVFPAMSDGSFGTPYSTQLTGVDARTLNAADFTGDGVLDLVVSYRLGMAEMLKGNPGAPFNRTGVFSTGRYGRGLVLDLDDQGGAELLLPDVAGGMRIVPFANDGTPLAAPLYGVAAVGTSYPSYDPRYSSVAVGDFSGDGKDDIALSALVANNTTLQVFRGGPLNTLARVTPITVASRSLRQLAAGDLTSDGRAELLALDVDAQNLLTYRANTSGGFDAPVVTALGAAPGVMVLGDFSGDGRADVAVTATGRILIFQSTGTGTFTSPVTINAVAVWLAAGDFNGDGRVDLAYTTTGNAAIVLNRGNNEFSAPVALNLQTFPAMSALRAADLNRDGKLDLVIGGLGTGQGIGVFLGDGAGAFRALPPQDGNFYAPLDIVIADIDKDGNPDLLTTHCCEVVSTFYRFGRGDGTFGSARLYTTGSNTDRIFLTDLNGDGKPEITAHTYSGVSVTPFLAPKQAAISSAASGRGPTLAAGSIASAYGANLATAILSATANNQEEIGGTRVNITDAQRNITTAPLFFVSAGQVNFLIPSTVAAGAASVTIESPGGGAAVADMTVARIAPGLFVVDSTRLVAANVIRVKASGEQLYDLPYRVEGGALVGVPIDLGPAGETIVLVLYGTGLRGRTALNQVTATIGNTAVPVAFAGAQTEFPGLDQVNVTLPRSLIGRGSVDVIVTVEGQASNAGRLVIQ